MAEIPLADIRAQVMFSLALDFKNYSEFAPDPRHDKELDAMLKQPIAWGEALRGLREKASSRAA